MPELPEVEVVRAGLERHVLGARIDAVEVLHPRPVRRDPRGPAGFAAVLTGRRVGAARRRGKYFWLPLDSGDALLGHLGMSGQMLVQRAGAPDERHLRVRFVLEGGGLSAVSAGCPPLQQPTTRGIPGRPGIPRPAELRFVDQRMFGGLLVSAGGAELPPEIAHIARDPLDPEFDDETFVVRVRRREAGIKRLLLDQGLVSGVGNIYADEALWRARLHGDRPGHRLRRGQVVELLGHVRDVLTEALGQGGTSFDALYVNVNGESGYFDRSLSAYGQEGVPCGRCGTPIRRVAFMNRSSFFCPRCQPVPRLPKTVRRV
ncbi:bifunctional DNA-formamidopyrimidine glycosylase/DNA-(apurinic or apyrimidinic site) lyase [Nocardioides antri]|uniref:Formamidopyrimidine-DNA glycosylase n=1 Tax=Nocardioides antri TaxID=2607659 RepID=A0A5B1M1G8_9ACTN|nr:bifunctional DNA-formamidopyrimidine glycosylase/DNA-(apurinic or apyrimidinic site) lyase [Nocardioides antri]KAA1426308.1 bifunctional DNA-formamidopyrimidine glycosylase/DNA-(apurinic or apyrimidinic site) lyase [Nocardioides antri]